MFLWLLCRFYLARFFFITLALCIMWLVRHLFSGELFLFRLLHFLLLFWWFVLWLLLSLLGIFYCFWLFSPCYTCSCNWFLLYFCWSFLIFCCVWKNVFQLFWRTFFLFLFWLYYCRVIWTKLFLFLLCLFDLLSFVYSCLFGYPLFLNAVLCFLWIFFCCWNLLIFFCLWIWLCAWIC